MELARCVPFVPQSEGRKLRDIVCRETGLAGMDVGIVKEKHGERIFESALM